MNQESIRAFIAESFDGVDVQEAGGDVFFIYDPERTFEGGQRIPFATLVTGDRYDKVSELGREGVFRLNVGLSKESFRELFPEGVEKEWDYTALDVFMPHPEYGMMYWVCVLTPSDATFEAARGYLEESYAIAVRRVSR